jgi:MFS transporter, FHS family, L-fucose permease
MPTKSNSQANSFLGVMIIIGSLFFVFGFVTWVNSVLIPYFKLICELSIQQAMLVAFAFYIGYLLMALPSSIVLKKTGYKNGMMLGLMVMAMGALIFVPAAYTREYSIFLIGLFVQASGLTLLQTAANPYVTILGPLESAASRISVMGVCNKIAGALAPLLLVGAIVRNPNEIDEVQLQLVSASPSEQALILDNLSERLVFPYIVICIVLLGLGLIIKFTNLPEIDDEQSNVDLNPDTVEHKPKLLHHRNLILGAVALFCAVGTEVLVIDSIINFAQYKGHTFREAKFFASYSLLIMILSYILAIFTIPKFISQRKTLMLSAGLGIILSILAVSIKGTHSVWFITILGLGNALLWPTIWPLALKGLGVLTSKGSALLVMGAVGGAVVPMLYGLLSDQVNPQFGYWVMVPFYLYILYYSLSGYKIIPPISSTPIKNLLQK